MFEACPTSLSLPAESAVSQVKLVGVPQEPGEVIVQGKVTMSDVKLIGILRSLQRS